MGEESINRTTLLNGFTHENGLNHILRFSDYEKIEKKWSLDNMHTALRKTQSNLKFLCTNKPLKIVNSHEILVYCVGLSRKYY